MKYAKITNGIVEQVQPYLEDDFIEAPDNVVPGFLFDGDNFIAPPIPQYDPEPIISFDDFESRFTSDEWDDATDYVYEVDTTTGKPRRRALVQGLARAQARNSVDLLDSKTDAFLSLLVTGNVITEARKTNILTP